ncbi:MAG: hypothetical protein HZB51_07675 [Chloroflexi bacterium]|nr:hypothetical protein [Chloroflexota bacterium]
MSDLKPCPYRHVGDEGHILCDKIKTGDREVTPDICRACPISHINCEHLRATLTHQTHPPLTVRYGNGRTEVWEQSAPAIAFKHAACAAKVMPIRSEQDCVGCALHQALVTAETQTQPQVVPARARRNQQPVVQSATPPPATEPPPIFQSAVPPGPVAHQTPTPAPTPDARSSIVAKKIIQLQEWLANQKKTPPKTQDDDVTPLPEQRAPRPHAAGEEKRVGWTD